MCVYCVQGGGQRVVREGHPADARGAAAGAAGGGGAAAGGRARRARVRLRRAALRRDRTQLPRRLATLTLELTLVCTLLYKHKVQLTNHTHKHIHNTINSYI